jgi:hypothetical protein
MQNSRREILVGIAGATSLVAADNKPHVHSHDDDQPATQAADAAYAPKVFTASELRTVGALTETIIPRTKTPGALDAKVNEIIDESLATRKAQLATWRKGLGEVSSLSKKLYKKEYADLDLADQAAVMTELAAKSSFFKTLKDATCDAYYSTREGLMTELGWDAAKPMPEFKGCTHPEHQV